MKQERVAGQEGIPAGKTSASFHMAMVVFSPLQIGRTEEKPYCIAHSQNPHIIRKKKDDGTHSIEHVYFSCSAVRL